MSKKMSQAEIDALVASLLNGDAPAAEGAADPADPAAAGSEAAPPTPEPAAAPQAMPVIGLTAANMPFELVADLGHISQAEVDRVVAAVRGSTGTTAPASPPVATAPPAAAPVATAPVQPPAPPLQATVPQPAAQPQAAAPQPDATAAAISSKATWEAAQAQAAQDTRRALSMAALMRGVLLELELKVTVELGRARLPLSEILALAPGSVVTLDKLANTPVDVLVNGVPMAKADVLAIAEHYGVRLTQCDLKSGQKAAS